MSSSFRSPAVHSIGEIDFFVLFQAIWRQKKLVLLAAFGAGVIASTYAFMATPEYVARSVLRPAAINELDALNRTQIYQLPPSEALIKVGASLESYDTRLGFFRANPNIFKNFERPGRSLEQNFEEFNKKSLTLVLPDSKKANSLSAYIEIELKYPKPINGVAILNGLVAYAIDKERQHVAADLEVIVKNRLAELDGKYQAAKASYEVEKEAKIASFKEADDLRRAQLQDELKALDSQLKTLRSDRITQLTEAITIAQSLGIRKPTTPSSLGEVGSISGNSVMRTEINNQQIPLYFMGVEALEAERKVLRLRRSDRFTDGRIAQIAKELQLLERNREIQVLNDRKNDDLFYTGVQPLRAEIVRLRSLNLDLSRLKMVNLDQYALEPLAPVSPKKTLIIVSGVLLGLIFGVFFVLLKYLMSNRPPHSSSLTRVSVDAALVGHTVKSDRER
ncbi:chain-length determining protein [Pseudomonas sp. S10E 269]|uniref:GNVR domain-containing protein n=1 Tax=unclassified Pseudomonas TaxID=196821 RepID=UPI000C263219|nr:MULTISPECIES: GNVR domain-containing protein [unclassified Pseudomonas]PJK34031.1 chain-length determining protein [Pseudomonas sp. S09F 262]PJK37972.1 chain-length determining protein [Pseudomonas sp. S10E 269]